MSNTFLPAQLQPFTLAGAGVNIGATTLTLSSMLDIDGVALSMTNFGDIGYGTIEPGNGIQEEQISFTGLTQNVNGTCTLTGVSSVAMTRVAAVDYIITANIIKIHPGGTVFVISNTVGFYDQFASKANNETITGQWTFDNTPIVPGTVSDASTTVKGVTKLSVAPASAGNPIAVGTNDTRLTVSMNGGTASGTNDFVITPSPAIAAYVAGQTYTFVAGAGNTATSTLNVNGLGAKTIKVWNTLNLKGYEIATGQVVTVIYDGTNFQLISPHSPRIYNAGGIQNLTTTETTNIAHGLGKIPDLIDVHMLQIGGTSIGMNLQNGQVGRLSDGTAGNGMCMGADTSNYYSVEAHADATNVIFTIVKTGTPGTVVVHFVVRAVLI